MPEFEVIRPRQQSRWRRFVDSVRSISLGPWGLKDRELVRYFGGGTPGYAGVSVSEENATTYSAVWAARNLIAGSIASAPPILYKRLPNGGKERFVDHPTARLLRAPNPEMSSFEVVEMITGHALLWGNGYAEIERDGATCPKHLWPIPPWRVAVIREGGHLAYRVRGVAGNDVIIPDTDMVHVRGLSEDGVVGVGVVQKARESIGLGLATERFGSTFFGNGATFGGVIKFPIGAASSPQARESFKKAIENQHVGVDRAHRLLALYDGGDYQQMGVPPEDAQFLQTRRFQIEEIARWFNLPPHKLKHLERSTYSNIEHQGIEYVTDTLLPWFRRWEGELNRKLISPLESNVQFIEFLVEGLLRGDAAGRAQFYKTMREIGAMTANEIRIRENLNPVEGGDTLLIPQQPRPALTEGSMQ